MLTLTKASEETKEILKWGGLFIGGLFALLVLLRIALYVKDIFFPSPPPKPTVSFGKLPAQTFPENKINTKLTYSLNTLTGDTPNLGTIAKIYRIVEPQSDLLALSRTKDLLKQVGFIQAPKELSARTFEWSNPDGKDIKIDIVNHNFIFTFPYLSDPDVLSTTNLNKNQAITIVKTMMDKMQLISSDIDLSKTKTISYSINNNNLIPATSLSNTQIVQVSLVQGDLDNLPIYYENPDSSSMNFLVSAGKVVGANFLHQETSSEYATYPIKTSKLAYEELQKGNGYIASYNGASTATIRDVSLAYYMSGNLQAFLMPIFVFRGDNGFYAYVPAIMDEWTSK